MSSGKHSMSCREMADLLSDYLEGELGADLRALIDDHRGDCPPCEAFIRTLARIVETVRAQPRARLSAVQKRGLVKTLREAGGLPRL
jgi:predicted anti-sigma-YlaC factor YlaD